MYITYALEKARSEEQDLRQQTHTGSMDESPIQATNSESHINRVSGVDGTVAELSTDFIAIRILELYANLVCIPGDISNLMKFAKTVTNKVCFARQVTNIR